ncbi:MAG TPA: prolipoprotein diacylglyceryl transferase [Candidatus Nanoarchaeia archaeon]|nr:prolipoprotein diacylglyceryl transferase [Candidatus Nanoarchaeia archaeon]
MFVHNINPTLLDIGPLEIRYYGIFYALGFVIAYFMINALVKQKGIGLSRDEVADYIFYLVVGVVAGARLFYVLYNPSYFWENPLQIVAVWNGGLIFLGGLVGALVAIKLFMRKKNIDFYTLADITVIPLAIGLALGRIGNFINGELVGRITSVPWAVKFPDYEGFRHPVQLYNSLANLSIFGLLWFLKDKNYKKGTLFWTFLVWYSSLRFLMGFFKEADQYGFLLGITVEQLIYLVAAVISIICLKKVR